MVKEPPALAGPMSKPPLAWLWLPCKITVPAVTVVPVDGGKPWSIFQGEELITGGVQGAYGIANLSAGVRDPDDKYELIAFVNNIGDQHYYSTIGDNSTNFGSKTLAIQGLLPRDWGRYAGIKLNAKF